jgi:hypothetical protein
MYIVARRVMQVNVCVSEEKLLCICANKQYIWVNWEEFIGVFKPEHKFRVSEIWTLVQTRSPTTFVERKEIKWNGTFEIG